MASKIYGAPKSFAAYRQQQARMVSSADKAALPILANPECERDLVKHIIDRVKMADEERNRRAARCQIIDVQMSGFVNLSADDKKRQRDNEAGKPPKPTKHNLPLTEAQIDECLTFLMSVYCPEMDFFEAVAPQDKQAMAQAVVAEMNKQSQKGQYYRHFAKGLLNMLKYNLGGWTNYWETKKGILFEGAPGGVANKKAGIVWQGNVINSFDVYNWFYDTSVHPVDLPEEGEFFAEAFRKTPFRIRKMAQDGQLYGIERYVDEVFSMGDMVGNAEGNSFYKQPPSVRDDNSSVTEGVVNWVSLLRGSDVKESSPGCELLRYTGWINPKRFKLSQADQLELWRVTIGNSKFVTAASRIEDSHGMLPIAVGCPLEDDLRNEQRTYAEKLLGLQHFSSFLVNSHQEAVRKAIYGITVYAANLFPGVDFERDDLIGATIPMRSSSGDIDISKAFQHINAAPHTEHHMEMVGAVDGIMQKILPTDLVRNVADLERATLYQAAATVQAGNRRQLKVARIISDQALNPLKFQMMYNLYANLPSISYIGPDGERVQITVGDLVAAAIEYEIGTGLKGMDRLMQIQIFRDVLMGVLQSQQALQEIDVVELLNYFFTMAGDRTDLRQFKRKTPLLDPKTGQPTAPVPSGNPDAVAAIPGSQARK